MALFGRSRGISRRVRQKDGGNAAPPEGLRLFACVRPHLAELIAQLSLSRLEENPATFWRFYPRDQHERAEVEAIAQSLRSRGLHVVVTPGSRTLEGANYKVKRVTIDVKESKKKQQLRTLRRRSRKEKEHRRQDRLRRNDPDRIDHEQLKRLRALREQTEISNTLVSPGDVTCEGLSHTMTLAWEIFPPGTVDEVVQF
jgi:hypothetical protein